MKAAVAAVVHLCPPTKPAPCLEGVIHFETAEWVTLLDWLRFHELDPMRIPAPSLITIDQERRQIRYTAIVKDDQGKIQLSADGLITKPAVQQGEGLAPLPDVVVECLR